MRVSSPTKLDILNATTECNFDADAYALFKQPAFVIVERLSLALEDAKTIADAAFRDFCLGF